MAEETPKEFLARLRLNIQRDIEVRGQSYVDQLLGELFKDDPQPVIEQVA